MTTRERNTSQHTPGPWKIDYAETQVRWPVIYVDDDDWDGGKREIAELSDHVAERKTVRVVKRTEATDRWRKTPDAEEAEANARLIAAAPEMLAALEDIAESCEQVSDSEGIEGGERRAWKAMAAKARAAARKATGA